MGKKLVRSTLIMTITLFNTTIKKLLKSKCKLPFVYESQIANADRMKIEY